MFEPKVRALRLLPFDEVKKYWPRSARGRIYIYIRTVCCLEQPAESWNRDFKQIS